MNGFWKEVDKALAEQGERRPWLAAETGISLGRINNWYIRGTLPRVDDAVKIAEALKTTVRQLVTGKQFTTVADLPKDIQEHVRALQHLPPESHAKVILICRAVVALIVGGVLEIPLDTYLMGRERLKRGHTSASPEPVERDRDAYKGE